MNDLVSVIVPIFKKEDTIEKCIWSIINQSYKNLEIILIIDGSPDNCLKICEEIALKDNRIIIVNNDNHGVSYSRNFGVNISKGKFLTFVDADDYLEPSFIMYCVNQIKNMKSDIVVVSSKNEDYLDKYILSSCEAIREMFINDSYGVNVWGKLYKKELFTYDFFPEEYAIGEDMFALFYITKNSKKVFYSNIKLYNQYRSNYTSQDITDENKIFSTVKILKKLEGDCESIIELNGLNIGLLKRCVGYFIRVNPKNTPKEHMIYLKSSLKNSLKHIKNNKLRLSKKYLWSSYLCILCPYLFNMIFRVVYKFKNGRK